MNKDKKPLSVTHPELAKEAHGWDPKKITFGSNKKLEWKCKKEHIFVSDVANRTLNNNGCPFCSNQKVLRGFNDLATTHPQIAKQANGWDPTTVVAGSNKKLGWKCDYGHEWDAVAALRTGVKTNCPVCVNLKILIGFNDLATTHPQIAKQANGWDPTTVVAGSSKKLGWKCEFGHEWKASVSKRSGGQNCPTCANSRLLIGFNDLATTHPHIAKQANGWDPTTVVAGSGRKLGWKCEFGHEWKASVSHRSGGQNCPTCGNKKVLKGFNDLATTHPDLAKEAQGWDPETVVAGSHSKLSWKCKLGHEWTTVLKSRLIGRDCPICGNKKVLKGFNDLATTHPQIAKQANGWDPTTVVAGSNKKLGWKCKFGHEWKTTVGHRTNDRDCPSCSQTGFDPNQNGYVYFLIQPHWEIYQIGITNFPEDRLKSHSKNGFELLELRGPMDGHTAQELETTILRYLKSQKADLSPEHVAGKFDGYSESWTIDSFQINTLKELIDRTREAGY